MISVEEELDPSPTNRKYDVVLFSEDRTAESCIGYYQDGNVVEQTVITSTLTDRAPKLSHDE